MVESIGSNGVPGECAQSVHVTQAHASENQEGAEPALSPRTVVEELDRFVIGQSDAKRAVAIALRNRWRRMQVPMPLRDEITPKNILMIGPTGVGKTEIARRLAKLAKAPFVKVEASKFTEVGYVGRDVDSIVRDLVEVSIHMVEEEERLRVAEQAEALAEEQLLDLLLPGSRPHVQQPEGSADVIFMQSPEGVGIEVPQSQNAESSTRSKLRDMLHAGKLEERLVEVEIEKQLGAQMQVLGPQGFAEIEGQIKDMFTSMLPKQKETKRMSVAEARKVLRERAETSLLDRDRVVEKALRRAEELGIVFIDEIDKVCSRGSSQGPDVSREGVQRDLLPLVEGSSVSTKYGQVRTDHILFIASGAFHVAKPSDLMPEFQGRFPIRVELRALTPQDFERILTEPDNALTKQYQALLATDGVHISFASEGIGEIARLTAEVNTKTENIGARRLHTLLEKLLEEVSFGAEDWRNQLVVIDRNFVRSRLGDIVADTDLSRFIL